MRRSGTGRRVLLQPINDDEPTDCQPREPLLSPVGHAGWQHFERSELRPGYARNRQPLPDVVMHRTSKVSLQHYVHDRLLFIFPGHYCCIPRQEQPWEQVDNKMVVALSCKSKCFHYSG